MGGGAVRDGENGARASLEEKKSRLNGDVGSCFPLLPVRFSSLKGASVYFFDQTCDAKPCLELESRQQMLWESRAGEAQ